MKRTEIGYVLIGVAFISLLAQVSFKISPLENLSIPITGQTLGVLTLAILSKKEMGFIIVASYLLLGAIGLPVFANGSGGWNHLFGNSAGYLWSFMIVPFFIGKSETQDFSSGLKSSFVAQVMGTIFILLCGTLYLSLKVGLNTALTYGFYPFILGGIIKSLLGAFVVLKLGRLRFFQSL